jgi:hypothetical protein
MIKNGVINIITNNKPATFTKFARRITLEHRCVILSKIMIDYADTSPSLSTLHHNLLGGVLTEDLHLPLVALAHAVALEKPFSSRPCFWYIWQYTAASGAPSL